MTRLRFIGANLLTAVATAAITSLFWIAAMPGHQQQGPVVSAKGGKQPAAEQPGTPAIPLPSASGPAHLEFGPTGVAIPVIGVKRDQLTDTFTQARANGRRHDAIDIMAPAGTPVVAAAPGTVEKLFFSHGGGGITAYVRSPDQHWMFYYAHLRNYAPGLHEGEVLRQGDPVGNVGSTGDANPAAPHLHLAINRMDPGQRWWQGTPINPFPVLAGTRGSR